MKLSKIISAASAVFATILITGSCSIQPIAWQPLPKPIFVDETSLNEKLANVEKISLDGWSGPEDIVFDSRGILYCGVHKKENDFSDGKILKIDPSGKVEIFYDAGSWVSGLHFDDRDNLIALSHSQGLISINPRKKATVLIDRDHQGRKFLVPNGLDMDSEQNIYFTNTSYTSPYSIKYGRRLILEMKPNGGLYKYNISTKELTLLIDGTYFGNGVVVSQDGSFLLMVETTRYRILKHWIRGENKGKTEVFMDNLPGFPNGISIRENGTFWLGFSTRRNDPLDKIHPKPAMKKLVYALPNWLQPKQEKFGMIMNVSADGRIIETLFDTTGEQIPEAGAVKEYNGYLYIGGDNIPYIGKHKINP